MYDPSLLSQPGKFIQVTIGEYDDLFAGGWFLILPRFLRINNLQVIVALGSDKDPLGLIFLLVDPISKNNPLTVRYFIKNSTFHSRKVKIGPGLGP